MAEKEQQNSAAVATAIRMKRISMDNTNRYYNLRPISQGQGRIAGLLECRDGLNRLVFATIS
jgi:hypothetical protein